MFSAVEPFIDGRPKTLIVYAKWHDFTYGQTVHLVEAFTIRRNLLNDGWIGYSATTGPNLLIEIQDGIGIYSYQITLSLRDNQALVNQTHWDHYQPSENDVWDTGLLTTTWQPDLKTAETHIRG